MKKNNLFIALLGSILFLSSCSKEDKITFDFPEDKPYVPNEVDNWLKTNFLDVYNIDVVYRYDRYKGNIERNISPPDESKVKDQMITVLEGFLKPYETNVSKEFIKKFTPKEWVLYGSQSYNTDGSQILGTAAGGRNVTLYEVNYFNINESAGVRRRLRTIHHEFTHILQQNVSMPLDFENISEGDYFDDWTHNTLNPQALSDSLGFISRYARSQYFEDFAETSAHLLIEGQQFYDKQAIKYNKTTYDRLKAKEALVVKYYRNAFAVDFRGLQRDLQAILYERFNDKENQSLGKWMFNENLFLLTPHIVDVQHSADFESILTALSSSVLSYSSAAKYRMEPLRYMFNTTTKTVVVRMPFTATAGTASGTTYLADYNFIYTYNAQTGRLVFTKADQGTGAVYNNAELFAAAFASNVATYLTSSPFIVEWSAHDASIDRRHEEFFNTGGFYKEGDRNSFINFQLQRIVK